MQELLAEIEAYMAAHPEVKATNELSSELQEKIDKNVDDIIVGKGLDQILAFLRQF